MLYLVYGLIAGIFSGLFGIGGGVIIVPALILIAKFSPERATGTSLAGLLLPVGILGVIQYYGHGDVDIKSAIFIAVGIFLGAWFGAGIALKLPARELQRAFSIFLIIVAGYLWWSA